MAKYILNKMGLAIFILLGITVLTFLLGVLSPGDPAEIALSANGNYSPTQQELDTVREQMGLNTPYYEQYINWVFKAVRGNLGTSYRTKNLVSDDIAIRLPITIAISGVSIIITSLIGILLGILMSIKKNGAGQKLGHIFSMATISLPSFWLAIILIFIFSETLNLLPTSGQRTWVHFILPIFVLSIGSIGMVTRLMHSSLDTQMRRHYTLVATSKGFERRQVITRHALKNALVPVITLLGNNFGSILGGSAIIESVFAINGLGKYALDSISYRDYPALQGYVLITGFTFVIINLLLDLIYVVINPQIQFNKKN